MLLSRDAPEKTAFMTRGGFWKWKLLTFRLTIFQRLIEQVLSGLRWKTLLDNAIIFSPDFDTHVSRPRELFNRL